jgi:alpha-glucosidase/alpha-D-xyloside xylohydrolase
MLCGCEKSFQITTKGQPGQLDIFKASDQAIRIVLKPVGYEKYFCTTPALADHNYGTPTISLREVNGAFTDTVGNLRVEIHSHPLSVLVKTSKGEPIQEITFLDDGSVSFISGDQPILGMGEGGPKPEKGVDWRSLPPEFDRNGRLHEMEPRWQSDAYGSRNPVPFLIGTGGWGLFVVSPWVQVDLRGKEKGSFIPLKADKIQSPQNKSNQGKNLGKGIPPMESMPDGLFDIIVFDAHDPTQLMKDVSILAGPAVLPPKWALGYMQSHRTLDDDQQMIGIVETFRKKQIPVDAVIYLGTGFCPQGWNTEQPSFDFNPKVFKHEPQKVLQSLHDRNVKVIVHMVPWDRDKLPTLHGSIPPAEGELLDDAHIQKYWLQHVELMNTGIDAFWPDEGDWFNLFERLRRHQLYYQGPISTMPNTRPWSLHRNGHLGIAKWGGWVWSGDTQSSWKTLETQIAVGINHSLSLSPFWGSDTGGFYPNPEKTGELYARWFQFASFNPSFRSHGRTWKTSLPWGFGLKDMGVREANNKNEEIPESAERNPLPSSMNNLTLEPITKKFAELRYQLLPYNYTLAWQARETGMPMMRALWLHHPQDSLARKSADEFLWGQNMLIAPVYSKGAISRNIYLPKGQWYDWWTYEKHSGNQTISKEVDLSIIPIYVSSGSIIPFDPIRQYTSQSISKPTTIKVFTGADGNYTLYDDDGISLEYLNGKSEKIDFLWSDALKVLTIRPNPLRQVSSPRKFKIELIPSGLIQEVDYNGKLIEVRF